ncbi:MAG: LysR family transcriptional regulator [Lachnospirales bacterium]
MEIRQLEYFVTSVEEKSFYKASKKLYTSQPAISKSMATLEKELGTRLLNRTNRGLTLTNHGEKMYYYAKNVLGQLDIMKTSLFEEHADCITLSLASYPSKLISKLITKYYNDRNDIVKILYREGTVQDIINFVYKGITEIGIVYISPNQEEQFDHILSHSNLEFVSMKKCEMCVYVGEKHELFNKGATVTVQGLSNFKYIRGVLDFFSVEHHFDYVSLNEINVSNFKDIVVTDSDHLSQEFLKNSDLCQLSINTKSTEDKYKVKIDSDVKDLKFGYIKNKSSILSETTLNFVEILAEHI